MNSQNAVGINGVAGTKDASDKNNTLENVIKNAINWILSILSLIVFVLLLW